MKRAIRSVALRPRDQGHNQSSAKTLDEKIAYGTPLLANGDSSESFTNKSEQKRSSLDPENQKKMGMEEIRVSACILFHTEAKEQ